MPTDPWANLDLGSAARTAGLRTEILVPQPGVVGVVFQMDVTSAGTLGVDPVVHTNADPNEGTKANFTQGYSTAFASIIAIGSYSLVLHPDFVATDYAAAPNVQGKAIVLPPQFVLFMDHQDAVSITYELWHRWLYSSYQGH